MGRGQPFPFGSQATFDKLLDIESLREAIRQVFDELNGQTDGDLSLCFRDALSKQILKVA